MEKTGYFAYMELKEEYGDDAYTAYQKLCVEKKDPTGNSITVDEIKYKIEEIRMDRESSSKKEEIHKGENRKPMTPEEFAKAVYNNEKFITLDGKIITIVLGPDIVGNVTGVTENGERVKANAKDLQLAFSKDPEIPIKDALETALKNLDTTILTGTSAQNTSKDQGEKTHDEQ